MTDITIFTDMLEPPLPSIAETERQIGAKITPAVIERHLESHPESFVKKHGTWKLWSSQQKKS